MCWSWRVNKHQSDLTKRRMLSAKFNFGKADPVAPAPLGVACRGLVGAGSCQRAVPTSSSANAEEQRKLIFRLREVGRYQSAAVEFFTLQTVKPHFQLCGTSGLFVCVFSYLGLAVFFFFLISLHVLNFGALFLRDLPEQLLLCAQGCVCSRKGAAFPFYR